MPLPKGVKAVPRLLADGSTRVYYYHRDTGRRLPDDPASPAFAVALRTAARGTAAPPPRSETFEDLVKAYRASPEWRATSPGTRHGRERLLRKAVARFDFWTVADLDHRSIRKDLYAWRDEMQATPRAADAAIDAVRVLLAWAYDRDRIGVNHALGVRRLYQAGQRRNNVWTLEAEERFLAAAAPDLRDAYLLALFTAARQSDLCSFDRAMIRDGWLEYTPAKTARKTGVTVYLPTHELAPLGGLLSRMPAAGPLLLTTFGTPMQPSHLRHRFAETKAAAGIVEDLSWHDIRGTTTTRLLEAGCTDAEAASVTGHAIGVGSSLGDYAARSRILATNAYRKWAAALAGRESAEVIEIRPRKTR